MGKTKERKQVELTVAMPSGEVKVSLFEPTFDQFRGAMLAMETPSGKTDRLAAGSFFLKVCVVESDREKLNIILDDDKAHAAAALEASELLRVYNAELKKK